MGFSLNGPLKNRLYFWAMATLAAHGFGLSEGQIANDLLRSGTYKVVIRANRVLGNRIVDDAAS
jgi:hypothetical protein